MSYIHGTTFLVLFMKVCDTSRFIMPILLRRFFEVYMMLREFPLLPSSGDWLWLYRQILYFKTSDDLEIESGPSNIRITR
jgi:hypothetical protein